MDYRVQLWRPHLGIGQWWLFVEGPPPTKWRAIRAVKAVYLGEALDG